MFGTNLRKAMEIRHMSIPELAQKMNMSTKEIYNYLRESKGTRTIRTYRRFAKALGCTVGFLMQD